MAIHEHALGPLYFARVRLNRPWCPVHRVDVVEMNEPWRRGRAAMVPISHGWALAFGIWTRSMEEDIEEDFDDSRWFNPKWLSAGTAEIKLWDRVTAQGSREPNGTLVEEDED